MTDNLADMSPAAMTAAAEANLAAFMPHFVAVPGQRIRRGRAGYRESTAFLPPPTYDEVVGVRPAPASPASRGPAS